MPYLTEQYLSEFISVKEEYNVPAGFAFERSCFISCRRCISEPFRFRGDAAKTDFSGICQKSPRNFHNDLIMLLIAVYTNLENIWMKFFEHECSEEEDSITSSMEDHIWYNNCNLSTLNSLFQI